MLTIILISIIAGVITYHVFFKKKRNTPPEPVFSLPIVGHMFFLFPNPVLKFMEWSKKCGKIMQIRFGAFDQIVIDDPVLAKETFNMIEFTGKPDMKFFDEFSNGRNGILFSDGPNWEEQRRFTLWHLRDFGFGKKAIMESKILDDCKDLVDRLKTKEGSPIDIKKMFDVAVLNTLWSIVTSQRYSHDDPQVTLLIKNFENAIERLMKNPTIIFFPGVGEMFPKITGWGQFKNALKELRDFFALLIEEHKKDLIENNPRDFIDVYLDEINKTENPKSSFFKKRGEENLQAVVFDLFQAGFATTSMTLNYSVLHLVLNPGVQKKFQEEIDKVIGKTRPPSLDDKANMPYTEALMMEVFRVSSLVGMVSAHAAIKDTTLSGYEVKKGTWITVNVYSIHHNPNIWKDPENFRPERFIDAQGKCVKRHDALIPFSVGKRICLGEVLARDSFFLFLVSIFQRFTIKQDPNLPPPSTVPKFRGTLYPKDYNVVLEDRF